MAGPQSRLAVDLSSSVLRVVDGVFGGPMRAGSGGTPAGALVGGKIIRVDGVATALNELLSRTQIRETRALVAVSDAVASFRVIRFPSSATDVHIESVLAKEFPADPERMATRWMDVHRNGEERVVYAVVWDRALVKAAADVARAAGLEPHVVELKSACVARAVAERSCIVVDVSANPIELFLIDDHLPQVWHSFELGISPGEDVGPRLVEPLRQVLRFYGRRRDSEFKSGSPIMIAGDHTVSSESITNISTLLGHPVQLVTAPRRVPQEFNDGTYLTCLGMLMRRG